MVKTSVVILNWNGENFLKSYIPTLLEHTLCCSNVNNAAGTDSTSSQCESSASHSPQRPKDVEIVVADNGSTDGSVTWLKENYPQIRLILFDKNYGFTGGYNRALEQVEAEYFLLLNSDVRVSPGWLDSLVDFMDNTPDAGICMPKILKEPLPHGVKLSRAVRFKEFLLVHAGLGKSTASSASSCAGAGKKPLSAGVEKEAEENQLSAGVGEGARVNQLSAEVGKSARVNQLSAGVGKDARDNQLSTGVGDGTTPQSAPERFEYAGACGGFMDRFGYPFCRGRVLSELEEDNGQYDTPMEVFWASGAAFFIRSSVWRTLDGFDSRFFAHMEEIDLCWRAKLMGYEIWVVPVSKVYHVGGGTLPNESPFKLYLNYRNNLLMLHKNLPAKGKKRLIFIRMLMDGASAIVYLLTSRRRLFISVLKAHRDFKRMRRIFEPSPRIIGATNSTFKRIGGVWNGSIVLSYFTGRRRFSSLKF